MAMKASTNKTNVVRKHPYTYVNMFFYRFKALRKIIKVYKTWMHSKVPRQCLHTYMYKQDGFVYTVSTVAPHIHKTLVYSIT